METILYLEVNLICIAILVTVYIRDARQRNNDTYHILFTRVLFSNILFFMTDIVWGLLSFSKRPFIPANWAANIVYFSMSGLAAYYWMIFVERMIDPQFPRKKIGLLLYMLPATLLIFLSVVSVWTHWLFYIDEAGRYQRGEWYIFQPILAYLLPACATFRALRAMQKSQNNEKKRQYRSLALFYVLPAIGGIGQVLLKGTPMLNIGIALSALCVYFTFQDNVIMLDPLTSMNNRRCFDKGLEATVHSFEPSSDGRLWLILMDVDYFKKINDGFGHAEGDRALMTIASVLKEVSGQFDCLAARIGGDEFAIFCESHKDGLPKAICDAVQKSLAEQSNAYPFRLRLSMGVAEYSAGMTPQQLFVEADKKLYEVKRAR